jgi:hypothetical protein
MQVVLNPRVQNPLESNLQEAYASAEEPETMVKDTLEAFTAFVNAMPTKVAWQGISSERPLKKAVVFGHGGPGVFRSLQELEELAGFELAGLEGTEEAMFERLLTVEWCDPAPEVRKSVGK